MNRKLLGGVAALVLVLVAVWFLWLRHRGDDAAKDIDKSKARTAAITPAATQPANSDDKPAPRGVAPKWTLDKDPEGPLRLEGQVLGPDGKGIGGAEVRLGSVPARTAKSEDDGSFSFDKLVGRTYFLTATSGELIGGPVSYKLTSKSDPIVIRLAEGAAVNVTVVDDAAKPLEGAEVKHDEEHGAKTNAQGKATLKPVHPGWVAVEAKAAGYAPNNAYTTIGSSGATGEVKIILRKGFTVSGRVIDETGKPVAKAKINATAGMWGLGGTDDEDAVTDDKGQFQISALAAGTHVLSAVDGEHAPARSAPVTVADRPITGVEITMKAGGVVAGTVLDTDHKVVPFATVRIGGTMSSGNGWNAAARQATTEKDGTFEIRGLARQKLQARAESDTAASKVVDADLSDKAAVKDLELVLDVSGRIAGVVVDDKGAPVTEVQVNAFPDILGGASTEGIQLAGMSSATTDGAGAFVIHGLPPGAYKLWAARSASGAQEWGQSGTSAKVGDTAVKITLAAPGVLIGKVVLDGSSTAPKLVTVQLGAISPTPATDGAFQIKEVNPGTYDVTFRSPEFAELIKRDIKIEPGKTTDMGTITAFRGRKFSGKVVDSAGTPVAGAKIKIGAMLFSAQGQEEQGENFENMAGIRSAISDQDGAFMIIGVPTKTATTAMADHADRGRSLPISVPAGTDDPPPVTLALRGFGSITGKVTQKGKPLGHVGISEASKGGGAQASFAQTGDDGTFTMAKVPEGTHVLQAMQQKMMAMKGTSVTVNVTAGKETKVTIDIPSGQNVLAVSIKPLPNNVVNAAQVFVFKGLVAFANGKQVVDAIFQGGDQTMKFWLGPGLPDPEFDEMVPGDYSVCSIPITGKMDDPMFMRRLQENVQSLKVYCKSVKLTAAPIKQTFVHELPAMTPLPAPAN
jgi:protocatechuate 3,4-dioxygenase beta subunit